MRGFKENERVRRYKEKGFTTVRDLANLYGISYVTMRRVLDYNKILADKEVKRGAKTFYLFDNETGTKNTGGCFR